VTIWSNLVPISDTHCIPNLSGESVWWVSGD
jgi:hypothetical protein